MKHSYYDVVLLGRAFENLVCAALLARRGFRVLVLGQDQSGRSYNIDAQRLPAAPQAFVDLQSPVWRRIASELALGQHLRRLSHAVDPVLQVILAEQRFCLWQDAARFDTEMQRVFSELWRPAQHLRQRLERLHPGLDDLLGSDITWPPESLLERRRLRRAASDLPFDDQGFGVDVLGEFSEGHPFCQALTAPLWHQSHCPLDKLADLPFVRLLLPQMCGLQRIGGGLAAVEEALIERLQMDNGEWQPKAKAQRIVFKRGSVRHVELALSEDRISCRYIIFAGDDNALLRLLDDDARAECVSAQPAHRPHPCMRRYTLNVVTRMQACAPGMQDRFVLTAAHADPQLAASGSLSVEVEREPQHDRALFCVQALVPIEGAGTHAGPIATMREQILDRLRTLLPFLPRHVTLIDSPHDGREVQDVAAGTLRPAPEPWRRGPHAMSTLYRYPQLRPYGLCAHNAHTPLSGLLRCGPHQVPSLGLEGQLLSAWSVARLITHSDRKNDWLRRGRWTASTGGR